MAPPLKIATVCMLLFLCVGSDLARPAICLASSTDDEEAAAGAQLKPSLLAEQHGGVGDVCTSSACQSCLLMCLVTCAFTANLTACFANCTLTNGCFSMTLLPVA